jgi:hypothetical protein
MDSIQSLLSSCPEVVVQLKVALQLLPSRLGHAVVNVLVVSRIFTFPYHVKCPGFTIQCSIPNWHTSPMNKLRNIYTFPVMPGARSTTLCSSVDVCADRCQCKMAFNCHSPPLICLDHRMGREADRKRGDHSSSNQWLNHAFGEHQRQGTPFCSIASNFLAPRRLVQMFFSQNCQQSIICRRMSNTTPYGYCCYPDLQPSHLLA